MEEYIVIELQNNTATPYTHPITGDDPTTAEHEALAQFHAMMHACYQGTEPFQGALVLRVTNANGKPEVFIKTQELIERSGE